MAAVVENVIEHLVLPHISWETFERIMSDIGKTRKRAAYHRGNLEFTATSLGHNRMARWIDNLIFSAALDMNVPLGSGGSTTLMDAVNQVAIEPDACFWIRHEGKMRGKKSWASTIDPPPDLAVEVDIAEICVDRIEIYRVLCVPEVWRFDGKTLKVLVLGASGRYKERPKSAAFPPLPMDGFVGFVKRLDRADEVILIGEFTQWLRSNVVGKKANGERKNGRR